MKKYIFPFIIALSAISVSASAAFYSVYGLFKLFSGAGIAIIIMASALEISKLVVASLLHQYWKELNKLLKIYLSVALGILMLITSLGIYGFLTHSYQQTYNASMMVENQLELIENKLDYFNNNIDNINSQISLKSQRIITLVELRTQQETRLDSLYNKNKYKQAKATEGVIFEANNDIKFLEKEMDTLNINLNKWNDSINITKYKILELTNNNQASAELGPLKYLSNLLNKPMDQIINWYMLLIIFVFDPLAIALVLVANFTFSKIKPKKLYYTKDSPVIYEEKKEEIISQQSDLPEDVIDIDDRISNILNSDLSEKKKNKIINQIKNDDLTINY
jgi:hypothetical protein